MPDAEKSGRRHSSTVIVACIDAAAVGPACVEASEVRVDTFRASGAGGQHRNKTDSGVRMTHLATGIVVTATEERSQHQNRRVAQRRLDGLLAARARDAAHAGVNEQRTAAFAPVRAFTWTGWRDEVRLPDGRKVRMSSALKGRFALLLR